MNNPGVNLGGFDNSWFSTGAPRWKVLAWYVANLLLLRNRFCISSGLKAAVLRAFGAEVGHGVVIKPGVNIKYPWRLRVGDNTWIGEGVWIDNLAKVDIASDVCISQGAMLLCGNHDFTRPTFDLMVGPIALGRGAWVGAKATVCPGVTMGEGAVLVVGSVASHDLEPWTIYRGNPAAAVRKRRLREDEGAS